MALIIDITTSMQEADTQKVSQGEKKALGVLNKFK